MAATAARKVTPMGLPLPDDLPAAVGTRKDSPAAVPPATSPCGEGLPPPTKWQVFYWAEVCGAVSERGRDGILDDAWPPNLAPDAQDLKHLAERGLLAKRRGRWRLRRRWYERLSALKACAVPTPALEMLERPAPNCPTYSELEVYEHICRWLDARPKARSRLPFTGLRALGAEDEEPIDALRAMRRLRLVRHTGRCEWALSSQWREQLQQLQQGIARALRKLGPAQEAAARTPASLCAGLDTWGLNWLVEAKTLPPGLRMQLDDYQRDAQGAECEVETRWTFDGVPLRIYQAGVRAKSGREGGGKRAKGVSWSYILVNPSLRLLVRRTPLGGIVANARLGSECLWRRAPLAALNELHALVRRMWQGEKGRWQVSYAHLAHDVSNAPLEVEQLDHYVSRSRRRALFDAALVETERLRSELRAKRGEDSEAGEDLDWDALPTYNWEAEYAEDEELFLADPFAEEGYEWDTAPCGIREAKAALEEPLEQRALTVHRWGKRLSGVAFSQGGPISFVMYRKDWEGQLKGKRHMEPLWKAAGWDGVAPVTRHEARLARETIRELRAACAAGQAGVEQHAILDDPWEFLACEGDVWGAIVGRAEACPGAVDLAWIRRVVPRADESNRSRWDTDPAWRLVQRADFGASPLAARRLVRHEQRLNDLRKIDQQLLGLVKTREAILHVDPTGRDLSVALRDVLRALEREVARRGEDFGQAARLRRRDRGLRVGTVGKVLPFRPRYEDGEAEAERVRMSELEAAIDAIEWAPETGNAARAAAERGDQAASNAEDLGEDLSIEDSGVEDGRPAEGAGAMSRIRMEAWLRWRSAETRMRRAFATLEAAELAGRPPRELERLAVSFERASAIHAAAEAIHRQLSFTAGSGTGNLRSHQELSATRHD